MHRVPIPPPPPPYCLTSGSRHHLPVAAAPPPLCDQQPSVSMLASSRDFSHRVKLTERMRNQVLLNLDAHDRALWRQAEGPVSKKGINHGTEGCYFRECSPPPYSPYPRRGGCYKVVRRPDAVEVNRGRSPGGPGSSGSPQGRDEISMIPFGVLACLELDTMEEPPLPSCRGQKAGGRGRGCTGSSARGGSSDWERSTEAGSSSDGSDFST